MISYQHDKYHSSIIYEKRLKKSYCDARCGTHLRQTLLLIVVSFSPIYAYYFGMLQTFRLVCVHVYMECMYEGRLA